MAKLFIKSIRFFLIIIFYLKIEPGLCQIQQQNNHQQQQHPHLHPHSNISFIFTENFNSLYPLLNQPSSINYPSTIEPPPSPPSTIDTEIDKGMWPLKLIKIFMFEFVESFLRL